MKIIKYVVLFVVVSALLMNFDFVLISKPSLLDVCKVASGLMLALAIFWTAFWSLALSGIEHFEIEAEQENE